MAERGNLPANLAPGAPLPPELESVRSALVARIERETSSADSGRWVERTLQAALALGCRIVLPENRGGEGGTGNALGSLDSVRLRAEEILRRGEPLLAYNLAHQGLAEWPGDVRLRQIQALALARSGAARRARVFLQALVDEGHADGETSGLLARTHKDLAAEASDAGERRAHLEEAFRISEEAFRQAMERGRNADADYTGINAATLAVRLGRDQRAREIASQVRDLCRADRARGGAASYWLLATLGEASLILGDPEGARESYAEAARLGAGRWGDLSSTRRQARSLLSALGSDPAAMDALLPVPPVLAYAGPALDVVGRDVSRFSPELERELADEIRRRLDRIAPAAAYGSAAAGADLLVLEAMRDRGGETHLILPFPPDEFRATAVAGVDGRSWGERFDRALAAATSVTITSDHRAEGSASTFHYANLILTGMAELRRRALDTELVALAVRDERVEADGSGAPLLELWSSRGVSIESIDLPPPRSAVAPRSERRSAPSAEPPPAGREHVLRSMLFADATGYSRLTESQTPVFVEHFLGRIAGVIATGGHRPQLTETMGDGLYAVFGSPREAGRFALDLRDMVNTTAWEDHGLPAGLGLRIALHCGPVYHCFDPVSRLEKYTGPHTSRTARIEPITPPGSVYASSAFAAVAAAEGVDELGFDYIGHTTLAKKYGALALYHVRRIAVRGVTTGD